MKNCLKFLADGNKVKVTIRFRGRMLSHSELGLDVMKDFFGRVNDFAVMEQKPVMEGRTMSMMLSPKKQRSQLYHERRTFTCLNRNPIRLLQSVFL